MKTDLTKKELIVILDILDGIRFDCYIGKVKYDKNTFTNDEFEELENSAIRKIRKILKYNGGKQKWKNKTN